MADDNDGFVFDADWMIFIGALVGMALLAVAVLAGLGNLRANHREDGITKRAKYEACQALENEIGRTVCINGWNG